MSVILTNGATNVIMRASDFQVIKVPPWKTPSRIINNSVGLPRSYKISDGRDPRILTAVVSLERTDRSTTVQGLDSLVSFFEGTDHTGVNGDLNTFMLTDADGDSYQVRFADDFSGGLTEGPVNQYNGTIQLINEHTLPSDEATAVRGWWAAYDVDNNGGDLSAWTHDDAVGDAATEWEDKSGNDHDGTQSSATFRPLFKSTSSLINNRPALDFDGTNDRLDIGGDFDGWVDLQADQPFTCYMVIDPDTFTTSKNTVLGFGTGGADLLTFGVWDDGGGVPQQDYIAVIDDGITSKTVETNADLATTNPAILSFICTGTALDIYLDGVIKATAGDFNTGTLDVADPARIGAVNLSGVLSQFFDGRIGELIFFDALHTDLQRRRQEFRLSDMWGIDLAG